MIKISKCGPILMVDDVKASVQFYVEKLGFKQAIIFNF